MSEWVGRDGTLHSSSADDDRHRRKRRRNGVDGAEASDARLPEWKQKVVDSRGNARFHGAFTGGFSAGYHNTVGSKEGFQPAAFVSTRAARHNDERRQDVRAFMDAEDLADLDDPSRQRTADRDVSADGLDWRHAAVQGRQGDVDALRRIEADEERRIAARDKARQSRRFHGGQTALEYVDGQAEIEDGHDLAPQMEIDPARIRSAKAKKRMTANGVSHTFRASVKPIEVEIIPDPAPKVRTLTAQERNRIIDPDDIDDGDDSSSITAIEAKQVLKDFATGRCACTFQSDGAKMSRFFAWLDSQIRLAPRAPSLDVEADEFVCVAREAVRRGKAAQATALPSTSQFTTTDTKLGQSAITSSAQYERFTSSTIQTDGQEVSTSAPLVVKQDPAELAAQMGHYGHRTRKIEPWRPERLLCKRFGVPRPTDHGK